MEDSMIIEMYWNRNESAIEETDKKYGSYCFAVANNILNSKEDSDECVNDTWIKAWDSIPPECPRILKAFLCRITRNLSIDRYRQNQRRAAHVDMELILDELAECLPEQENSALTEALNAFFVGMDPLERKLFLGRYWHATPVKTLAKMYDLTPNHVSVRLHRTRERLRAYLTERGFAI